MLDHPDALRADALHRLLREVVSLDEAMTILSFLSPSKLREFAWNLGVPPADSELEFRQRVAEVVTQHGQSRREHPDVSDLSRVTPERVRDWALSLLVDWVPGHTPFDKQAGGVFVLSYAGTVGTTDTTGTEVPTGIRIEVRGEDGGESKTFVVALGVAELDGKHLPARERRVDIIEQAIRDFPHATISPGDRITVLAGFIAQQLDERAL